MSIFSHKTYTVESVTSGHPDKVCDQISDAILDACLKDDPQSRVAVETFGSHGLLVIGGEVTTRSNVDYEKIARQVYKDIGYEDDLKVIVHVSLQSPDIALGVNTGGAGDQGWMAGYATNETPEFMPQGVVWAHKLAKGLEKLRRDKFSWIKPDGKTQVTVIDGKLETVLVSTQHSSDVSQEQIRKDLIENLIKPVIGEKLKEANILVNPTGNFEQGGFEADAGLTGRKLMVDTYGGLFPHGGGCFSGKDGTKVDRSAAYMCRFVAKNLVANGHAEKCIVSASYAIGKEEPLMIEAVNEKGESLAKLVKEKFDFRPLSIIERLNLRQSPSGGFVGTAAYGHFGKPNLPWEEVISL